jgi:hypothetical protein
MRFHFCPIGTAFPHRANGRKVTAPGPIGSKLSNGTLPVTVGVTDRSRNTWHTSFAVSWVDR